MVRYGAVFAALLLSGCGTYHEDVIYVGTPPASGRGTISPSNKAMVFATMLKPRPGEGPVLHVEVVIEGYSRFRLLDSAFTLRRRVDGRLVETRIPLQPFRLGSGLAKVQQHMLRPGEEFAGPGIEGYKPYYATQPYRAVQWFFDSETPLQIQDAEELSVVLPNAVVDGEAVVLPVVTFKRKVAVWREEFNLK